MDEIIQGYPKLNRSITNPDVKREDALDRNNAFTFLEFIQNVRETYEPSNIQNFYNEYIRRYNNVTVGSSADNKGIIIDHYRDFLKDITLNYSTNAEKTFLSQIDFSDNHDLQIAVSFYSKKIRDIISYYQHKRDLLFFSNTKTKLKGSNFGLEQHAYQLVLDFLENRETAALDYNIGTIKENISISLTEYFDQYTEYFNQEPDEQAFGKNYLQYSPDGLPTENIFLTNDTVLVEEVFAGISEILRQWKQADQLFETKREQAAKFIAADYYYLSSNAVGDFVLEELFKADAPYANFLNTDYPSVASVFSNDIKSERDQGFFKPSNSGIVSIESERLKFFTKKSYQPNSLYIFPDPNLFTNNDDIFVFTINTTRSINNQSKGIAVNQPNTDKNSTSLLGYNSEILQDRNLNTDLSFLFDQGYIDDSKKDLFGNIFGLLKDNNYYRNNFIVKPETRIKNLILNGYQFFDTLYGEGYDFNFSTTDRTSFENTFRSGLTSFTGGLTAAMDTELLSAYDIFFRYFGPYETLINPPDFSKVDLRQVGTITTDVKDGAFFKFSNSQDLEDPIRAGLSAYNTTSDRFFFSDLIEAGISYYDEASTIVRALCDSAHPAASGNFAYSVRLSGDNGVKNYDAGLISDNMVFPFTPGANEKIEYNDEVLRQTVVTDVTSAAESFFAKKTHCGKIYVKNINKASNMPNVKELTETLTYIDSKYNSTVANELSTCVKNFDIFYNTLFIETSAFLVVEQLEYKNNAFANPGTITNTLTTNSNFFDKVSNRFKVDENVFYCKLVHEGVGNTKTAFKDFRVYPEIYKYSYVDNKVTKIYPTTLTPVVYDRDYFNCVSNDVIILEASKPQLTYSSENEIFNLSFILKDQNQCPRLYNYLFEYKNRVKFLKTEFYIANEFATTFDFIKTPDWGYPEIDLSFINFALSSGAPELSISYPPSAASIIL